MRDVYCLLPGSVIAPYVYWSMDLIEDFFLRPDIGDNESYFADLGAVSGVGEKVFLKCVCALQSHEKLTFALNATQERRNVLVC